MTKPEPVWWAYARQLRAEGWKLIAIAAFFHKHETTVEYALHEETRRKSNLRRRRNRTDEQRLAENARERYLYARRPKKKRSKK